MDATTPTGVQSPAQAEPGSEAAFQDLVDRGLLDESAPPNREPDEDPQQQKTAQEPQQQEQTVEAEGAGGENAGSSEQTPETEKTYSSLDEYLKEAKLESESFMQLPVTVKVDGQDRAVPLSEVLKGYQISSAGYNRMQEVAHEKAAFEAQRQQVSQALVQQVQRAEDTLKFAQEQLNADFQAINWQQLEAENPGQAALLFQRFQARNNALNERLNQISAHRQQEAQQAQQARLQALPQERAKLLEAIPEYRDPAKLAAAQTAMRETGQKVGFSDAELNGITDHRFVRVLDMAARWAALQAKAPATVNRVRTAPQMAKPGTRQVRDAKQVANQQLQDRWAKSGYRDDEIGAAIFDQF